MDSKNGIHFVIAGGTIDSLYDGTKDTVVPNKESIIPKYIKCLKLHKKTEFTQICMKDSREINKENLKKILKAVEESPHTKILITHGTYTMSDTARYLKAHLKRKDQTIILTGSMIPLDGFTLSDAGFNLGYSISELEKLFPGVYICMNGKTFSAEESSKIIVEGRFESLFTKK